MRAEHGAEALCYAVLEGVAFSFADGYEVLREGGATLESCLLVGGGARSRFWAEMLANIVGVELSVAEGAEHGGAWGAARLGMLAARAGDEASVCAQPAIRETFRQTRDDRSARLARFRALYSGEFGARIGP